MMNAKPSKSDFEFLKRAKVTQALVSHIEVNIRDAYYKRVEIQRDAFYDKAKPLMAKYIQSCYDFNAIKSLGKRLVPQLEAVTFTDFAGQPATKSHIKDFPVDVFSTSTKHGPAADNVVGSTTTQRIGGVDVAKSRSRKDSLRGFKFTWEGAERFNVPAYILPGELGVCIDRFYNHWSDFIDKNKNPVVRILDCRWGYERIESAVPEFISAWVEYRKAVDELLSEKWEALGAFKFAIDGVNSAYQLFTDNPELWAFVDDDLKQAYLSHYTKPKAFATKSTKQHAGKKVLKGAALRRLLVE